MLRRKASMAPSTRAARTKFGRDRRSQVCARTEFGVEGAFGSFAVSTRSVEGYGFAVSALPLHLIEYIISNYCTNGCMKCLIGYGVSFDAVSKGRCSSNYCHIECDNICCEECAIYCDECKEFYCSENCFNSETYRCYWCDAYASRPM